MREKELDELIAELTRNVYFELENKNLQQRVRLLEGALRSIVSSEIGGISAPELYDFVYKLKNIAFEALPIPALEKLIPQTQQESHAKVQAVGAQTPPAPEVAPPMPRERSCPTCKWHKLGPCFGCSETITIYKKWASEEVKA